MMTVIGITGPTGSGKSSLLPLIERRGGLAIDCDRLYTQMLTDSTALRQDLAAQFGPGIFLPDGTLDRRCLGELVFSQPEQLAALDRIVFYHIGTRVRQILQQQRPCCRLIAIDAVNLLQSNLDDLCNVTVCVTAPPDERLRRIMQRDGLCLQAAQARISSQQSDDFYRRYCSYTLENTGLTRQEFLQEADRLIEYLIKEHIS